MRLPLKFRRTAVLAAGILLVPQFVLAVPVLNFQGQPEFNLRGDDQPMRGLDARLLSALDLLNRGKTAEAIEAVRAYLKEQPNSAPAHEVLGAALAVKGELDQGITELKRALALEPKRSSALTKIGDILLAKRQVKEAQQQFLAAITIASDDRLAHQRLGLIYQGEGKRDLAITHLEKGLAGTPPGYIGIKTDLARQYNLSGNPEKAVALLQPVTTRAAKNAAAWMELGAAYRLQRKPDQAIASFKEAAEVESKSNRALIAMGMTYRETGRGKESLEALQKAVSLDGKSDLAQLQLGETQFGLRQYDQALASFRAAEKNNPKLLFARKRAADTLVAQNKIGEAIAIYKELLKTPGIDRPELYDALGTAYQLNNELALAEKTLKELVQKHPKQAAAHLRLGMYYGYVKQYDQALAQFEQGLKLATDKRSLLRAISVAQRQKGSLNAARKAAEDLVKQPQSGAEEKFYLASLYQDEKNTVEATRLYLEVIGANPGHAVAHNNLAMLYSDAGKHAEAQRHAERAAALAPEIAEIMDTLGWVRLAAGQLDKAVEPLKKATIAAPANPMFHYHLAVAHSRNGQRAEALSAANRALETAAFPARKDAEKLRDDLQKKPR